MHCELDVDECEQDSHVCGARAHEVCVNSEGSFHCQCQDGYARNAQGLCEGKNVANTGNCNLLHRHTFVFLVGTGLSVI